MFKLTSVTSGGLLKMLGCHRTPRSSTNFLRFARLVAGHKTTTLLLTWALHLWKQFSPKNINTLGPEMNFCFCFPIRWMKEGKFFPQIAASYFGVLTSIRTSSLSQKCSTGVCPACDENCFPARCPPCLPACVVNCQQQMR